MYEWDRMSKSVGISNSDAWKYKNLLIKTLLQLECRTELASRQICYWRFQIYKWRWKNCSTLFFKRRWSKIFNFLEKINVQTNENELCWVAGHLEVTKYLLSKGAIANVKDNEGKTPADMAIGNFLRDAIKQLVIRIQ